MVRRDLNVLDVTHFSLLPFRNKTNYSERARPVHNTIALCKWMHGIGSVLYCKSLFTFKLCIKNSLPWQNPSLIPIDRALNVILHRRLTVFWNRVCVIYNTWSMFHMNYINFFFCLFFTHSLGYNFPPTALNSSLTCSSFPAALG